MLAAEESSRVRGGSLFGGVGGPLENYVGDVSRYVIGKAPCRVILTAPPADWRARPPSPTEPVPAPADGDRPAAPTDGGQGGTDAQKVAEVEDPVDS